MDSTVSNDVSYTQHSSNNLALTTNEPAGFSLKAAGCETSVSTY